MWWRRSIISTASNSPSRSSASRASSDPEYGVRKAESLRSTSRNLHASGAQVKAEPPSTQIASREVAPEQSESTAHFQHAPLAAQAGLRMYSMSSRMIWNRTRQYARTSRESYALMILRSNRRYVCSSGTAVTSEGVAIMAGRGSRDGPAALVREGSRSDPSGALARQRATPVDPGTPPAAHVECRHHDPRRRSSMKTELDLTDGGWLSGRVLMSEAVPLGVGDPRG